MKSKVLVVEDDRVSRNLLKLVLKDAGYDVLEACDGEEALRVMTSEPPGMILLDIMMPGMSGWEVCQRVRNDDELKEIPIIMITAKHSAEDVENAKKYKVKGYLLKPFQVSSLENKIKKVLGVSHDSQ